MFFHTLGLDRQLSIVSTSVILYRLLVLSVLLYGCESWTWTDDLERRIKVFENKCYIRMLCISHREHKTNEYVWQQVTILPGPQELLLSTVNRRKLPWFGHVCRHDTRPKIILQVSVDGRRRRGRRLYRGRTTSMSGRASRCHNCSAFQRTGVDGGASQRKHLSRCPQRRLSVTDFE